MGACLNGETKAYFRTAPGEELQPRQILATKNPSRGRVLGDLNEVNSGCPLGTGLNQTIATTNLGVTKLDQLATNIDNQLE